ncbi:ankyrin repeat domain-containing protein [Paucibacter sp. R3-3]|uniref:Ankyrin repeat domain-containing protein n=1 Tax=Roseateles agri TaxID=3098619 RepID=A0ABU5DHA0_9BURK|nr:ankyrin repeat domain-containing protein [Paucibacter sp. R3-3]MDY0745654.1 ankyrin repeat domain-containing protein [Paucibacter sp. R3-3]
MTKKYLLPLLLLGATLTASAAPIDDLTTAVELDNGREVLALLVKGVDANGTDQRGRKPLGVALREGSEQAFDALLADPRVDVVSANDKGETPLMLAAIKGRLDWAKKLVARGAKINQPGWTPLHYACTGPDGGVAAWLLTQGADVNARSPNGTTPLMMASRYGASENVAILLKAGADVSLKNEQDLTAVDFAKKAGRDLTVKQLLAATPR